MSKGGRRTGTCERLKDLVPFSGLTTCCCCLHFCLNESTNTHTRAGTHTLHPSTTTTPTPFATARGGLFRLAPEPTVSECVNYDETATRYSTSLHGPERKIPANKKATPKRKEKAPKRRLRNLHAGFRSKYSVCRTKPSNQKSRSGDTHNAQSRLA